MGKILVTELLLERNIDIILKDILNDVEKIRIKETKKAYRMLNKSLTVHDKNIIENMTKNIIDKILHMKLRSILKKECEFEILIKYLPYFYSYRSKNKEGK